MNVSPPLTGRLMYYASPSDQGGWWGAGRWGVSMSDAPWHWLYKWLHLHAFHFPAHRSRDELIGPSLIGDDWLQLGLPAHPDGLHVWQRLLTQWLNCAPPTPTHIPVSLGPNCQRHKGGQPLSAPGHRCDHESLLALAEECAGRKRGKKNPLHAAIVLICGYWVSYDAGMLPTGKRPFRQAVGKT